MANYQLVLGILLAVTCINLFLFVLQRGNTVRPIDGISTGKVNLSSQSEAICRLLRNMTNNRLFVIEPYLLTHTFNQEELNDLKWRFNLPEFVFHQSSLTLAMFGHEQEHFSNETTEIGRVEGIVPFSNTTELLHLFLKWHNLNVHVVVLHRVKHFLWVGQIDESQIFKLHGFSVYFGRHQEIYDPFGLTRIDSIQFPDEIGHFLGQIPTSRYMHCPSERKKWNEVNNVKYDQQREEITVESIVSIKSLMKELRMEFWALCGTLLGWYRQCGPIPYTTDNDFSTWPKYLQGQDISSQLRQTAPQHKLRLYYRFGEPWHSMEYSFKTRNNRDKVDMFFTYKNGTHFLLPFHIASKHVYQYSIYPPYDLCSMELLGFKLLAPCQAEKVISAEYGPHWDKPKKDYDYAESPFNSGPKYPFPSNISQYTEY